MKINRAVFAGRRGMLGPGDEDRLAAAINEDDAKRLAEKGFIELESGDEFTGNPDGGAKGPARRRRETDEAYEARRDKFLARQAARVQPESTVPVGEDSDLSDLTKEDLQQYAEDFGIEVERADGKDGEPLKADYVRAIAAHRKANG